MQKRFFLLILLFVAGMVYFGYLLPTQHGIQVGEPAPVFALSNEQGEVIRLSDFRGQPVLLNFWATWCPPCIWEMPSMERLGKILAGRKNFAPVGLGAAGAVGYGIPAAAQ